MTDGFTVMYCEGYQCEHSTKNSGTDEAALIEATGLCAMHFRIEIVRNIDSIKRDRAEIEREVDALIDEAKLARELGLLGGLEADLDALRSEVAA